MTIYRYFSLDSMKLISWTLLLLSLLIVSRLSDAAPISIENALITLVKK